MQRRVMLRRQRSAPLFHSHRSYVDWIVRFVLFHGMRSREDLFPLEQAALALRDSQVRGNGGFGVFADEGSVASGTGSTILGNNPDLSDRITTL